MWPARLAMAMAQPPLKVEAALDGILNSHGLDRKDLDLKCPREIRDRIAAEVIDEWYMFGRELKVSQEKLTSTRRDSSLTPEEKAVDVLDAWAEEHGSRATCLTLARTLYGRKKTNVLEILCDEVKRHAATTSGAGAAVSPQPSEQQQQLAQQGTCTRSVDTAADDVLRQVNDHEKRFRQLNTKTITELEDKKIKPSRVLSFINLLPTIIRQEYKLKIDEIFPQLKNENTISDMFYRLSRLVDFLGYGLLKHIIDEFGSDDLKKMMNDYSKDVVQFMKKTTVKQLMDHLPGQQEIPPNFSKLQAKIDEDPTTYTLYDLDQKRRRFCCENKLTDLVSVMIGLGLANSFIVEWLVPSALVPKLMESAKQLDFGFYHRERILKVVVGEKQIFPFLPDSKPKVPALQTTAAMVTDVLDEETDPAATQLSSSMEEVGFDSASTVTQLTLSMEQLSLTPTGLREAQRFKRKFSDSSSHSGVGIVFDNYKGEWDVKNTLKELNFKCIFVDRRISQVKLKTSLSNFAKSIAYALAKTQSVAGSQPFVIAVFVAGRRSDHESSCFLNTRRGPVDIVDDIIKPFLPKSSPHLAHIPKLFFISSRVGHKDLDTQPPSFPDDDDANYCIAYHLTRAVDDLWKWRHTIELGLHPGKTVQDVIEDSRSHLDKDNERLYTFSCLKGKLIL